MGSISEKTVCLTERIGSNRTMACLLLPICLWMVTGLLIFGVSAEVMAASRALQVFYILLLLSLSVRVTTHALRRKAGASLLTGGILLVLLAGLFWYGFRFKGTFELGKGELFSRYQKVQGPNWGPPPLLPIGLFSAPSQNNGKTTIVVNDRQKELPQDGSLYWKWYAIRLVGEAMAPFLLIDEAVGEVDKAGFVRLPLGKEPPPYFTFGTMPHRIYLTMPETGTPKNPGVTPTTLRVRIMRGKLNVLTKEVRLGELVRFEGHSLRFENGSPWVRLEIRDLRPWYLLIAGLALSVAGVIVTLLSSKRRLDEAGKELTKEVHNVTS